MWIFGQPNIEKLKLRNDIKGLINALSYRANNDIRRQAAIALGVFKDPRAIEPLILSLKDNDGGVRREAAIALGEIKDSRALDALISSLKDNDPNVQLSAKSALDQMNWSPQSEREYALYAFASGDRSDTVRFGMLPKLCMNQLPRPYLEIRAKAIPSNSWVSEDKADYIINLVWSDTVVGRYTSGQEAIRRDYQCNILKRRTGKLIAAKQFLGDEPDKRIPANHRGPAYGIPDPKEINEYIERWYNSVR